MKKFQNFTWTAIARIAGITFLIGFHASLFAQSGAITTYQYRHVPDDKIQEFVKRETTYWAKVAEKAAQAKTMTFWALLEKVGGDDLMNSANFLFINTFPDIDKTDGIFTDVEGAAGVKFAEMETNSMSTTTSQFFLHEVNWVQHAKAVPATDFKYVVFNYQNTNYQDSMIGLEKKYWEPFIQKAMNNNQTPQKAWGNSVVLAPMGADIKFTTVSYDLFKTLQDALMPNWDPKLVFPTKGLGMIEKIAMNRRGIAVYRIVKVVTSPE
ncbi:MAG TPA: hypothetical protein VKA49_15150 [Flavitalea sp.]|nr:hypothetical protein [Flavitalea sp.]